MLHIEHERGRKMGYLVIKCGGSILEQLPISFFENIVSLMKDQHLKPIIVHGGGPNITQLLTQLEIHTTFHEGLRVTSNEVLDIVEMVLSGSVNKSIVRQIIAAGGMALGLSGVDGMLLVGKPISSTSELGYVGKIESVNPRFVKLLAEEGAIPVISPIAIDGDGQRWNINGDIAAAAIAKALCAPLYMVSDVPGILKNGQVLSQVSISEVEELLKDETISGGMIPKAQAALECLRSGVEEVVIINGLDENGLINLINGMPIGTKIMEDITCKISQ